MRGEFGVRSLVFRVPRSRRNAYFFVERRFNLRLGALSQPRNLRPFSHEVRKCFIKPPISFEGFFAQSVEPRIRVEADLPLIQSVNEMGSYLTNRPFAD